MGLDLYARIEPYLDFEEEIYSLHKEFLKFIMVNDLDNIIDIGCGQGYFLNNLRTSHNIAIVSSLKKSLLKFKVIFHIFLKSMLISLSNSFFNFFILLK